MPDEDPKRRLSDMHIKHWVDPSALPDSGINISHIAGNASDETKRLVWNVFTSYGVVSDDTFGNEVGKAVHFVEANVNKRAGSGQLEATVVCELTVTRRMSNLFCPCSTTLMPRCARLCRTVDMLNGAGMMHGGCIAYLIDKYICTRTVWFQPLTDDGA
jgi:acyl-coenzyme A thioesterase 13